MKIKTSGNMATTITLMREGLKNILGKMPSVMPTTHASKVSEFMFESALSDTSIMEKLSGILQNEASWTVIKDIPAENAKDDNSRRISELARRNAELEKELQAAHEEVTDLRGSRKDSKMFGELSKDELEALESISNGKEREKLKYKYWRTVFDKLAKKGYIKKSGVIHDKWTLTSYGTRAMDEFEKSG